MERQLNVAPFHLQYLIIIQQADKDRVAGQNHSA